MTLSVLMVQGGVRDLLYPRFAHSEWKPIRHVRNHHCGWGLDGGLYRLDYESVALRMRDQPVARSAGRR